MQCKMVSSQKSQENQRKYIEFVSEIMLSYHWRPCRELSNVEMYISGLFKHVVLFFIEVRWANRGPTQVRSMYAGCSTFSEFFEDCEFLYGQILTVHLKSIIPHQYASPDIFVVSGKNLFGFQFCIQCCFHAMQNVQFAEKYENHRKKNIEFVSEIMLSYHGRHCRELSNVERYV